MSAQRTFVQIRRIVATLRPLFAAARRADAAAMWLGVFSVLASSAILTSAPILLATVFTTRRAAPRLTELTTFFGLFVVARVLGQLFVDVRWLILNPLYYRMSYRAASTFCETRVGRNRSFPRRANRVAETSEAVVSIQKIQLNTMTMVFNLGSVIFPTTIDVLLATTAVFLTVGPVASVLVLLGLATLALSAWAFSRREAAALAMAVRSDTAVYRQIGQLVDFSRLIVEFSCLNFFLDRLQRQIAGSTAAHRVFFQAKCLRAFSRTAATGLAFVFVAIYVALAGRAGQALDAKQIFLLVAFLERTMAPMGTLSTAFGAMQNALVGIEAGSEAFVRESSENIFDLTIGREDESITARFRDGRDQLTFSLKAGEVMRVSGPSGAGKTRFLQAFFDALPREGARAGAFAYLSEKPLIVEGSIAENLRLGTDGVGDVQAADLWRRASRLPIEPDQPADRLSAGEMQILAACRALLRNPDLLIIDEGFCSMDSRSEQRLFSLIRKDCPQAILIIVAHRTALDTPVDLDLTFEDGTIRHANVTGTSARGAPDASGATPENQGGREERASA